MKPINPKILQQLSQPHPQSHKGQNGVVYIAAGSKQYHGSLWYAIETASYFVDLIYVETDTSNAGLVRKLKQLHPAMILVNKRQRKTYLAKSNALLLGPGLGKSQFTKSLVATLLTHSNRPEKVVIDADALYYLQPSWLTTATVLTPHAGEYQALFGQESIEKIANDVPAIIIKKTAQTIICQKTKCEYNTYGNAGLTKGGTGDVLATLIAALGCTNDIWLASRASLLLVGMAAEQLASTHGLHFSISNLIHQLPLTLTSWQSSLSSKKK